MVLLTADSGERHVYFVDEDDNYVDGELMTKEEAERHFINFRRNTHAMISYTKGGTVRCIHTNAVIAESNS